MKNLFVITTFLVTLNCATATPAEPAQLTIAAAADLKYALQDTLTRFKKSHSEVTEAKIEIIFGSSGQIYQQIVNGAPYDIFFSADIIYPRKLQEDIRTASQTQLYAIGRIVIWSSTYDASHMTLNNLTEDRIKKIAIANPKHAPYGKRAQEALEHAQVWATIQDKLVFGENIAQTAQFVYSGAADVGIIALSLALAPTLTDQGSYYLIPENFHKPLEQGYVILKRAESNPLAKTFTKYVASPEARDIFKQYGFRLPDEPLGVKKETN